MNRFAIALTLVALGVPALPSPSAAQTPWAFELRLGADVPTEDLGDVELGTGFGFEGTFRYRFYEHLGVYAGWDWIRFSPDDPVGGADSDIEETGYAFGLHFEHLFSGEEPAGDGWAYWARVGGIYDHIEVEDADGEIVADSGHGLGWEIGGGVGYGFAGSWSVTPGIRYRSLSRDLELDATTLEADLRYVALEVGVVRRF